MQVKINYFSFQLLNLFFEGIVSKSGDERVSMGADTAVWAIPELSRDQVITGPWTLWHAFSQWRVRKAKGTGNIGSA